MQNSQRVLLAKPRTAVASRWGARGARGARGEAAHRAEARRRDGDIAPYRNGTRVVRTAGARGEGHAARVVRTARGSEGGAQRGTRGAHGEARGVRVVGRGEGERGRGTGGRRGDGWGDLCGGVSRLLYIGGIC